MLNVKVLLTAFLVSCTGLSVGIGNEYQVTRQDTDQEDSDVVVEDTDDSGVTQPDYTGLIGGVIRFSSIQYGCYECFTDSTGPFSVSGVLAFHEPVHQTWNDWIPSPGTCTNYLTQNDPATQFLDLGQKVEINVGSRYLPFSRNYTNGTTQYNFSSTTNLDFQYGASYNLNVYPNSTTDAFQINNVFVTPERLNITNPTQLMNPFSSAFAPVVSKSGTTISWTPSGSGYFFVILDVYSEDGSTYLGGALCVDNDDGSIFIDPSVLGSFYPGSLVGVYMYRYRLTETVRPDNGSTLQSITQVGLAGTATLNY